MFSSIDLRRDIKKLEKMYLNSKTYEEKLKILEDISNLSYSAIELDLSKNEHVYKTFKSDKSNILNDVSIGEILHILYNIPKYRMNYKNIKFFKDNASSIVKDDLSLDNGDEIKLSKKDLFLALDDFYKSTNPYIYNYYKSVSKNIENTVKFDENKSTNFGIQYNSVILKKNYIEIGTDGYFEEILTTLVHEVAHAISCYINENRTNNKIFNYYEIESIFFEIISLDYFYNYFNDLYFKKLEFDMVNNYYHDACLIILLKKVYNEMLKKSNIVDDSLSLFNDLTIDNDFYEKDVDINDVMTYLYSYIVATSFIGMYKDDKEKALDNILNVINSSSKANELEVISTSFDKKSLTKYLHGLKR